MNALKGYLATGIALIACPCHLLITLPLLLALTGGSAVGLWLAQNQGLVWLAVTGLFVGGLALAFVWLSQAQSEVQCEIPAAKRIVPSSHPK